MMLLSACWVSAPTFFTTPRWEACVVICRMNKPEERRNKVLFINAINEVTRERAQSFLTDEHIQRVVAAYQTFADEDGFARVASNDEIIERGSNLSIPLYVRTPNKQQMMFSEHPDKYGQDSLKQAIAEWQESSMVLRESIGGLFIMLGDNLPSPPSS